MNIKLYEILTKMNADAQAKGIAIPFPPTKEGYENLLRMVEDIKFKQRMEKFNKLIDKPSDALLKADSLSMN